MSAHSVKSYRVLFREMRGFKITLQAKSKRAGIVAAQKLWETEGEEAFTCYVGDTDAWIADLE